VTRLGARTLSYQQRMLSWPHRQLELEQSSTHVQCWGGGGSEGLLNLCTCLGLSAPVLPAIQQLSFLRGPCFRTVVGDGPRMGGGIQTWLVRVSPGSP
jgi:hypothetical protein